MSTPSNWPLPDSSIRYLVPKTITQELGLNIVSRGLYPLAFGYYENALGHTIRRDKHDDHLLILCIAGKGQFSSKQFNCTIHPGDVILIPKGLAHQYNADSQTPWTIYWAHLEGHLFEQFMDILGLSTRGLKLTLKDWREIQKEFSALLACRFQSYHLNSFYLASNICKKLISLLCVQQPQTNHSNKGFSLPKFDAFIAENMSKQITLEQMADAMQLSKFHFSKKFQAAKGISPMKYFLEKKIQHACTLFDKSNRNVKEVATYLGYEDPYYFSRLFKKIMGISPSEYRGSRHGH